MGKQIRQQKKSSIVAGSIFRLAFYLCVTIALIYAGKSAYDFGYHIFNQEAMQDEEDGKDVTVVLEKGDSVYQIGKILEKKGLIHDARAFVVQEKLSAYKGKIKPGTFVLNTGLDVEEIMAVLSEEGTDGQPDDTEGVAKDGSSEIQDGSSTSPQEAEEPQEEEGEAQ